ncbi:MAG: inositol monophosphatase [Actinomycetota bacterium]|nr:inositol monophosphatase [Actinomycetota bacterium]
MSAAALGAPAGAGELGSWLHAVAAEVLVRLEAAVEGRDGLGVEAKLGPQDLVTTADRAMEAWLFEAVSASYPDDGFLGEEGGWRRGPTGRRDWVVDPIDGTANFVSGLPWSCCSIGLVEGGEPVAGLVVESSRHDVFLTSGRRSPSALNDLPVTVAQDPALAGKVVLLEIPAGAPPSVLDAVERAVRHDGGSVRVLGAAALALAAVAAGRAHAAVLAAPSPWDIAAGVALVRHAGGVVLDLGGPYDLSRGGPVIAGNEQVAHRLQAAARDGGLEHLTQVGLGALR